MNILILASGKGTRVQSLSKGLNKALIPVGDKATLSYIVEKFPKGSHIYLTLGYLGEQVRDFCLLAYPDYKFTFISVPDYEGPGSGPGKSALYAEPYLQEPFYLCTCDCIVKEDIDLEDHENWIGIQKTDTPEIYSTARVESNGQVRGFKNKSKNGFENAFIGLAHIGTPQIFWESLKKRMISGELVEVFKDYRKLSLKAKKFTWYDTGNPESLCDTRQALCIKKNTGEHTYREGSKVIKYFQSVEKVQNLYVRGKILKNLIPDHLECRGNFIAYDWIDGNNLYVGCTERTYIDVLRLLKENYLESKSNPIPEQIIKSFYEGKTFSRIDQFIQKYGIRYLHECFTINGEEYPSMESLLSKLPFDIIYNNVLPFEYFHGDFQPANIVYDNSVKKTYYIDWRDSFGNNHIISGDLYYELGKMLGGLEINYDLLKDKQNILILENQNNVSYFLQEGVERKNVSFFKEEINSWKRIDYSNIELVRCLVQLSMAPLHAEPVGKFLWFRTIENLTQYYGKC